MQCNKVIISRVTACFDNDFVIIENNGWSLDK